MRLVFHILFLCVTVPAADFFVSTTGTTNGTGSIDSPWSIATGFSDNTSPTSTNHSVVGGDTLWIRGGTYYGLLRSYLTGNTSSNITIRPYHGERVVFEATNHNITVLYVDGHYSTLRDIEIWNSFTNRATNRNFGIFVNGSNTKLINLAVHDVGVGIYVYEAATNSLIYGGVFWNNGSEYTGDVARKHSIYLHSGDPGVTIENNVIGNGFGYAVHAYSELGEPLNHITVRGNIAFGAGVHNTTPGYTRVPNYLVGGHSPTVGLIFTNNVGYQDSGYANAEFGYQTYPNDSATISDNYFIGGKIRVSYWTNMTFTGNTIVGTSTTSVYLPTEANAAYEWDSNSYYDFSGWTTTIGTNYYPFLNFENWKTVTGFDANGTSSDAVPATPIVLVMTNAYERGRANVAVINLGSSNSVTIDASSFMVTGDRYTVRTAQNFGGDPVVIGTYSGAPISLPMQGVTVSTPVGMSVTPAETGPLFGAFVFQLASSFSASGKSTWIGKGHFQ